MAFDVYYRAWNSSNGGYATGDGGNHTVTVEVDQSDVTGKTPTEVGNGVYRVNLTDTELPEGSRFSVRGSSSTSDVTLHGESGVRPETMRGTDGAATPGDAMDFNSAAKTYGDSNWATATGFSTHNAGDVWTVATRELTSNANFNDPSASTIANSVWNAGTRTLTAFSFAVDLSSSAVQAIWDKATSALTTAGSIGKLLVDNIDAAISSRSSHTANDVTGGTQVATAESNLTSHGDSNWTTADLTTLNDPTAVAIREEIDSNSTQLAAIPKEGETHRYRRVAEDENNQSADVIIENP